MKFLRSTTEKKNHRRLPVFKILYNISGLFVEFKKKATSIDHTLFTDRIKVHLGDRSHASCWDKLENMHELRIASEKTESYTEKSEQIFSKTLTLVF